jgi:membrane-associated protease RseP (regulator of RpoE activity)
MLNNPETSFLLLITLAGCGFLAWGYKRAKIYGKLGILAWLQSAILMLPWLIFFALFTLGIFVNLSVMLFILVAAAGVYIWLGNKLRAAGQDIILKEKAAQKLKEYAEEKEIKLIQTSEILPISEADLKIIQGIFGIDTFFVTETISYQEGAIFKGNLRGEPDLVYQKLSEKLQAKLGDKYRLFLVESPEEKPVAIVLPSSNDPKSITLVQKNLAIVLLISTIVTSIEGSSLLLGFDFFSEMGRFQETLPISLGICTILAGHEIGHYLMAKRYNIRLSWPFFIPNWQIGSFGAITRFESLIPNRTVLFDIAFAGPAVGGIISFLFLFIGLILSHSENVFQVPTSFLQGSILVGSLAKLVLGNQLQSQVVNLHPFTIVGWLGLVITALNLLPAGQLDGGRIMQAIYGRKIARITTIISLVILILFGLFNPANPIPFYWAIIVLFLQRELERPSLNELTEPDDQRAFLAILALFLMLAIIIPFNPSLAAKFGIGLLNNSAI